MADERQRGVIEADFGAGAAAGDGKQQAGIVLRRVTDLATEAGILGSPMAAAVAVSCSGVMVKPQVLVM